MRKRKIDKPDGDPIRQRLLEAVGDRSTTDVAKATGFSLTNVHRYLHGGRTPVEFFAAFAKAYKVNPTWLLLGEGAQSVSDVTANTEQMAGDVLELVKAMNAVTHMRLGALTGKHHLRVLRELNDALVRYEDLRERLNEHTRPIFRRLLDDLRAMLARLDMERAGELRKALDQVARLCDDEELAREHLGVQAHHEFLLLNRESALEFQRKRFLYPMASGRIVSEENALHAVRLVITMNETGREVEAGRIAECILLLAGEEGEEWEDIAHLGVIAGAVMIARGDLMPAIARIQHFLPKLKSEERRRNAFYWLQSAHVLAGMVTVREAIHQGEPEHVRFNELMRAALLTEDVDALEEVLEAWNGLDEEHWKQMRHLFYVTDYSQVALSVMRNRRGEADKAWHKLLSEQKKAQKGLHVELRVFETQLERLCGRNAKARKALLVADEELKSKNRRIGLLYRALHHRNALQIEDAPRELQRNARAFFDRMVNRGYELFREQ